MHISRGLAHRVRSHRTAVGDEIVLRQALPFVIAAAIAVCLTVIVEKLLVHVRPPSSSSELLVVLECIVLSLIFSSFVSSELVSLANIVRQIINGEAARSEVPWRGVVCLFLSLIASLSIYYAFRSMTSNLQ